MWKSESQSGSVDRELVPVGATNRHDELKTDGFLRKDQSWFVTSDIPSDLLVKVGGVSFHLHKYPMLSRSGRMNRIIYESVHESDPIVIDLNDLPEGPDSFELAAKFCYGIAVDLTASNISGLRCTAEYLEMTEDLEEGNLIFKTEAFLSYVVLSSWRDSIIVLKSCEGLSPWAENLQIVRRCSESIAWKACANPRGIRWAYTGRPASTSVAARGTVSPRWNASDSKELSPSRSQSVPPDWWFEDVSLLRIDHFVRVVTAIKVKGMRFDLIGAAMMQYASKWLPGLTKDSPHGSGGGAAEPWSPSVGAGLHMIIAGTGSKEDMTSVQVREQRMVVESLISIIPPQKDCVSCAFLLRLLRLASLLRAAPALVTELEKRVGMQLEQASLPDLLVPSYGKAETMYDVDLVTRLVEHFLVQERSEALSPGREAHYMEKHGYDGGSGSALVRANSEPNAKTRVARLLDSYLTEVSRDWNLPLTKFQVLAEALPESARTCDDGLYRAIDSYLKAHPTLTEHERKRLCRVMDCQKLSFDACMHAAQNERLPLRVVVQVLFSEQVKITNALANSTNKEPCTSAHDATGAALHHYHSMANIVPPPTRRQLLDGTPQSFQDGWAGAKKDINTLKFELESMKAKYLELQHDMDALQKHVERVAPQATAKTKAQLSAWSSGWRKLGRLAKITNAEANEVARGGAAPAEAARKGPRRWRNSIS